MDESLEATIDGKKVTVIDGEKEFEISAGRKQLVIRQKGSDTEFITDRFRIWRNDKTRCEVKLIAGKLLVSHDGKQIMSKRLSGNIEAPAYLESTDGDALESLPTVASTPAEQRRAQTTASLQWILENFPERRQSIAEAYLKAGDEENAKRVLATVPRITPKAKGALELAKLLESRDKFEEAADSYLEAYRAQPNVLSSAHLPTIKRGKRVREFVNVFTEANLRKLGYIDPSAEIARALLQDEATREYGDEFLRRVWAARPGKHSDLLANGPDSIWRDLPDPAYFLRLKVIPRDISSEGAGWDRFTLESHRDRDGTGSGVPVILKPLLTDTDAVREVAREVESKLEQHPQWIAGVAVLGFLEAELGHDQRATELWETVLAETDSPFPGQSAWMFGLSMQGKSKAIDRLAVRLFERSLAEDREPTLALRVSALQSLALLYAKYDRRQDARRLLYRLADPEDDQVVHCSCSLPPRTNTARCTECHQKERSLFNYTVMSSRLSEIGYPVDALLSLAHIDASFANAYGSDEGWASANTNAPDLESAGRETFQPVRRQVLKAMTPKAVLNALESGVSVGSGLSKMVIAEAATQIDLMVTVRGENGKSTLYSPVIELFELAASSDQDNETVVRINELLSEELRRHPENVEAAIAATVFAFVRNKLAAAEKRLETLNDLIRDTEVQRGDVALWLVARLAIRNDRTRDIGRRLADRALAAAGDRKNALWKEAIDDEWKTLATIESASPSIEALFNAKIAFGQAKRLERRGEVADAANAYLEAFRGDASLLDYESFRTIKKANRVRDFVEIFDADRLLLAPLTGNPLERIAKDLMEDPETRHDGRELLHQMWDARADDQWPLLANPPKDAVFRIGAPLLEIRKQPYKNEKLPATDPDWTRFRANNTYEAKGRNGGLLQKLIPQLKDTVEQKIYLAKTAREVEQRLEQDPKWKAGVAVWAFLEAELGNEHRAIELIESVLTETEQPITCSAAMTFGQALEGRSDQLDRLVIRLYEKSVAEWGERELDYSLNLSPIQNLAGLYAKAGRREEARRLLLRLTVPEGIGAGGSQNTYVTCSWGSVLFDRSDVGPKNPYPKVRTEDQVTEDCMACHRKERNLFSYLSMSEMLTELGYPVDAKLSLARIDASFGNSYSSEASWRRSRTPRLAANNYFGPIREKVDEAITPQAVLGSLKSGAFNDIDLTNPVIAKDATRIDLMLSVRGENGRSTLFSPVVDILELAAKSNGDEAAVAKVGIDQLLAKEFTTHPENVEAGIVATVFAFLQGDFEAARKRSQKLNEHISATEPSPNDIALWLVARLALEWQDTESIGEAFTERALAAAEDSVDSLLGEAIKRERAAIAKIVALRRLRGPKDSAKSQGKSLLETATRGENFATWIAAVEASGLTDALSGPGPYTILVPTDDAFAKLPAPTLEGLFEPENKQTLTRILRYHLIPGRIPSRELSKADAIVTLADEPVYFAFEEGRLSANKAQVIATDMQSSNGLLHVIDEVLVPRSRTLIIQQDDVVEYDVAGNKTWEVELELPHEVWGLPTGERVVEHIPVETGKTKDDFGTLRGLIVYAAGDGPPLKQWSIPSSLLGATLLPDRFLVWTDEFVQRYDRNGSRLWATEFVWKGQKRVPLGVEPLPNGNLRIAFGTSNETFKTRPDTSVEINARGQVTRRIPYDPNINFLQRLPSGNSLVRVTVDRKDRLLEERDATGETIWSYQNDSGILTAQRLPSGDTLIGAIGQAKAIDLDGDLRWTPDKRLFKDSTSGYEAYRYYPVLAPKSRSNRSRK
ncbi:MAG: fasciclin domain-containing protein [Planctomycetota bacterium]